MYLVSSFISIGSAFSNAKFLNSRSPIIFLPNSPSLATISSFLWKMLQRILPTEERVARILPSHSSVCGHCDVPMNGTLEHFFFDWILTGNVGQKILSIIQHYVPETSAKQLISLDFQFMKHEVDPIVWRVTFCLLFLWESRKKGKAVDLTLLRSYLEAKINLLGEQWNKTHKPG